MSLLLVPGLFAVSHKKIQPVLLLNRSARQFFHAIVLGARLVRSQRAHGLIPCA